MSYICANIIHCAKNVSIWIIFEENIFKQDFHISLHSMKKLLYREIKVSYAPEIFGTV
jgi:hypothetical protein